MFPRDGKPSDEEVESIGASTTSGSSGSCGGSGAEYGVLPVSLDTEALAVLGTVSLRLLCGVFATATEGTTGDVGFDCF